MHGDRSQLSLHPRILRHGCKPPGHRAVRGNARCKSDPGRPPAARQELHTIGPVISYLICASPRSGSTLLCELLKDTGVAGRPEEYFEARYETGLPPHPGDYLSGLARTGAGIREDSTPPDAPEHSGLQGLRSYDEHLERTFRLGTTPNGVFGSKLMWNQVAELRALTGDLPELSGLGTHELLERLFGSPRYVLVSRRDKVRQAVSMWRALQTRAWRLEDAGGRSRGRELRYSFEGIRHLVGALAAEDEAWREHFARHALDFLEVSYEDRLEVDREGSVRAVLDHVGVEPPAGWAAPACMRRQADDLSQAWVAAYHRDAAEVLATPRA